MDIVADQYPIISIKNVERGRRAESGSLLIKISSGKQQVPKQWKKFLSSGENKTALVDFLFTEWAKEEYAEKLQSRCLYFAHGQNCHRYEVVDNVVNCEAVPELDSTQEEADTRMFLHANHAGESGNTTVVIKTVDTDVLVIACHFQSRIHSRIYIHTGTKTRTRYLDIQTLSSKLGSAVCGALPGLHSFTGCDTNSAFAGKGKKKAFDFVVSKSMFCEAMHNIGSSIPVSDDALHDAERFVCALYGMPGEAVDEVRYKFFCGKNPPSQLLPPCSDALGKHTTRANYQAFVWRSSLEAKPDIPSPHGHGWIITNEDISIDWMDLPPAPKAILELLKCGCTTGCSGNRCTCFKNRMPCTDCCGCSDACENSVTTVDETSDSDVDTDSD